MNRAHFLFPVECLQGSGIDRLPGYRDEMAEILIHSDACQFLARVTGRSRVARVGTRSGQRTREIQYKSREAQEKRSQHGCGVTLEKIETT